MQSESVKHMACHKCSSRKCRSTSGIYSEISCNIYGAQNFIRVKISMILQAQGVLHFSASNLLYVQLTDKKTILS